MGVSMVQGAACDGHLALAVSRIHRSRSIQDLQRTYLALAREFVRADAFGMYLFNDRFEPVAIYAFGPPQKFISEYEDFRAKDPLLKHLMATNRFTHTLELLDQQSWLQHPMHEMLSRWGYRYSIEAPLTVNGTVRGTINVARGGKTYYDKASLEMLRFLWNEINVAFQSISEVEALREELKFRTQRPADLDSLQPRGREVMEAAVSGLRNREIARRLGISENTVRCHLKKVYSVLGVHTRAQLVRRLYSDGD